jgi:hypothetical protein
VRRRRAGFRRPGRKAEAVLLGAVGLLRGPQVARREVKIAEVRDELLPPARWLCDQVQVKVRRQRVEAPSRQDKTQRVGGLRIVERRRAEGDAEQFVVGNGPDFADERGLDGLREHGLITDPGVRHDPVAADRQDPGERFVGEVGQEQGDHRIGDTRAARRRPRSAQVIQHGQHRRRGQRPAEVLFAEGNPEDSLG